MSGIYRGTDGEGLKQPRFVLITPCWRILANLGTLKGDASTALTLTPWPQSRQPETVVWISKPAPRLDDRPVSCASLWRPQGSRRVDLIDVYLVGVVHWAHEYRVEHKTRPCRDPSIQGGAQDTAVPGPVNTGWSTRHGRAGTRQYRVEHKTRPCRDPSIQGGAQDTAVPGPVNTGWSTRHGRAGTRQYRVEHKTRPYRDPSIQGGAQDTAVPGPVNTALDVEYGCDF